MKLPRDLSGAKLAQLLERFGYHIVRQTGSHIRLTTSKVGEHHLTIPAHPTLRVGTLSGILRDVAEHFQKSKEEIAGEIFRSS